MEFLTEYGLFLAKTVTVVIALLFIIAAFAAQALKDKLALDEHGHIKIKKLNDVYDDYEEKLQDSILDEKTLKDIKKERKKALKSEKQEPQKKPRVFLIDFEGDVKASAVEKLRKEISAILTIANANDEVVINIESPGGMVHTYGLAASQLVRLKNAGIPLTVCVDKVAASGGYLMACVADKILAAPFAIVGSIGVLAQIPNFNRVLKKHDVDYEIMTAGEYKAPITMFGEITEKGKNKLKEELEETHELFKSFITQFRSSVDIEKVATGEVWYGQLAIERKLVDEVMTSDDYLMAMRKDKEIFHIVFEEKKSIQEKLGLAVFHGVDKTIDGLLQRDMKLNIDK